MPIAGRCHCGNISFQLRFDAEPERIAARACGCSFCVKHGGVWTSFPSAALQVVLRRPEQVRPYAFGTRTARFHVCTECGVVPVVTSRIDGREYAVVNVNTFEGVDPARVDRSPASFDGEGEGERLARRARHWIADVRFEGPPAP